MNLAAIAIATYVALTNDLLGWELDITEWLQQFSLGPARFLKTWMPWMGNRGLAGGVLALVVLVFWFRDRRIEAAFLLLIVIPDLFNIGLREIIGRARPSEDLVAVVDPGTQGLSFPSGTTLHTLLFYGFLLYLAGRFMRRRRLVYTVWAIGILYILLSGFWVVYYGRHWFLDAIGGYLYGGFYLLVLILGYRWTTERVNGDQARQLPLRRSDS